MVEEIHMDEKTRELINNEETVEPTPTTGKPLSRRQVLKLAGYSGLSVVALCAVGGNLFDAVDVSAQGAATPAANGRQVYGPNAQGLVVGVPSRCVGCRRCELACTDYNEGMSQPAMSRIKIARNYTFGPQGPQNAYSPSSQGEYGNHLIVQELCKQCPHPVPCQLACPYGAIEISGPVNARIVNQDKCRGCRTCLQACPWGMTSFNEEAKKATKCHLCSGKPECVQACPTGALQYIPWQDLTKTSPRRFVVPSYVGTPKDVTDSCAKCH
jgi:Fe-S-cluster-containing dehydrogenase component